MQESHASSKTGNQFHLILMASAALSLVFAPDLAFADTLTVPDFLVSELSASVHELGAPRYLFHYEAAPSPNLSFEQLDQSKVDHLRKWSAHYWDRSQDRRDAHPKEQDDDYIRGLYLAQEPAASRGFTGTGLGFLLYRIEFPASMKYIDVSDASHSAVSEQAKQYLQSVGCQVSFYQELLWKYHGKACRDVAIGLLKALHVDAIKYDYTAGSGGRLRDCTPATWGKAFIVIDPAAISSNGTRVFTSDSSKDSDGGDERKILRVINASVSQGFESDRVRDNEMISAARQRPQEVVDYEAAHIIGCENLVSH